VEGTVLSKKRTVPFLEPEYCYTHGRWDVRNSQNLFAFVAIELVTLSHLHNKRDSCLFFPAVILNLAPVIFLTTHKNQKSMLNSGQKNPPPQISSLIHLFLQYTGKCRVFYKIRKDDNIPSIKKYCIILDDRQQSYQQGEEKTETTTMTKKMV
jgi:hypothetical protein